MKGLSGVELCGPGQLLLQTQKGRRGILSMRLKRSIILFLTYPSLIPSWRSSSQEVHNIERVRRCESLAYGIPQICSTLFEYRSPSSRPRPSIMTEILDVGV